jgi:CRP/FNR family cyclic AMP-dependent transcriptional regulator
MAPTKAAAANDPGKKSGIRTFKPKEGVFSENDPAESLYIIQRGQIRLYRPKGRGFVELAILRSGEVIGEMAYFDEKSRRRSCSAQAMVTTDVIEISFQAFSKTFEGLNPWFKTIINTLANRLRKTNEKVKELENNQIGFSSGGKVGEYKFILNVDVVKLITVMYMTLKSHGEIISGATQINYAQYFFYSRDIFAITEVKFEEFYDLLQKEDYIQLSNDKDGQPKLINVRDVTVFKQMLLFFNTQRTLTDDKKLIISSKCERFLKRIYDQLLNAGTSDDSKEAEVDISQILTDFKTRKVPIFDEDLKDAIVAGICDDILVGPGNKLISKVNFPKLKKIYPCIKMMNAIERLNETHSTSKY